MGFLSLRLLPQLIQEKGFLPNLDVVTEEECNRELKKEEEIGNHSKPFFFYPQTPDAEGGVAEDENINIIFIHKEILVPFQSRAFTGQGGLVRQNRIKKPDLLSVEGVTFISRITCPLVRSNEKQTPINISLNVSSLDCRSLNFVKVFDCSNEPFSSG